MKIFAIGDIHGCYDELMKGWAWIEKKRQPGDKVVLLGDYVDRGPKCKEVLYFVKGLMDNDPDAVCLRGNHEDMMITALENAKLHDYQLWHMNGGETTLASLNTADENIEYFLEIVKRTKMWQKIGGLFFVHAGVDPTFPVEFQTESNYLWIREPFLSYKGQFKDKDDNPVKVVHGHTPTHIPAGPGQNRFNLDTGCVFGSALTIAMFENDELEKAYIVESDYEF